MSLLDGAPAAAPAAAVPGNDPPAGADPAATGTPGGPEGGALERPDWLPEDLWTGTGFNADAFAALKAGPAAAADLPAAADAYVLPTIEGFDSEVAGKSPVFGVLRTAAFDAGIGQAGFDGLVKSYVEGETAKSQEATAAEMALLGANATARLTAVNTFIRSTLPADEADALAASVTSAKAVMALEKLMGAGKPGGAAARTAPAPVAARESRAEIEKLMATPAYSGKESDRDPAVVKKVSDWFDAEYNKK